MSRKLEIELEKRIAAQLVLDILTAGYSISVDDGEETVLRRSTDATAIAAAMYSTAEDWLHVHKADQPVSHGNSDTRAAFGWVRLIYGNVQDVISDYTTNLEPVMAGAEAIAKAYD